VACFSSARLEAGERGRRPLGDQNGFLAGAAFTCITLGYKCVAQNNSSIFASAVAVNPVGAAPDDSTSLGGGETERAKLDRLSDQRFESCAAADGDAPDLGNPGFGSQRQ
jgi:hypothetical protein